MAADVGEPVSAEAESPLQQYGYVRCYRAVVQACGVQAAYLYGLLEDYVQMGARTKRGCVPSHEHLAGLMGVHRNTVVSLMQKLRDAGWVEWTAGSKTNTYFLPARKLHKKRAAPAQNLCSTSTNIVHNQERTNKNHEQDPPVAPQGAMTNEPTRNARRRIPQAWALTEHTRAYAIEHGIPESEVEAFAGEFKRYWQGDGRPKADWDLTFMNRVREKAHLYQRVNGHAPALDADYLSRLERRMEELVGGR